MISSFSSIRTKTSLLFFILFVVIILPVNWIIYRKTKSVLEEASQKEMAWEAEKLMGQVKLDPLIVPLSATYDIQLQFKGDIQNEVIFVSPDFPALPDENLLLDYYHLDTLEIINVNKNAGEPAGMLVLTLVRSNTPLVQRLSDLKLYLFLASSASIALAGILVYLASGWMLRPIHRISQAASRIQASETIERVPIPRSRDESRTLAEALNAMLERIEKTIKNQTNFFASATHELKTPLAIMKAELSTAGIKEDPKMNGLLTEVDRLENVITDFLLISQLKSDSLIIRKRYESVEEMVYRALQKITYLKDAHQPHIHVTLSNPEADYCAFVDADKMETVLINLFENAMKYSHPKSITILLNETPGALTIEVSNPVKETIHDMTLLIQEFKKSKELSVGLGMGLWICQQILKLHGGSLNLISQQLVFKASVTLPKELA